MKLVREALWMKWGCPLMLASWCVGEEERMHRAEATTRVGVLSHFTASCNITFLGLNPYQRPQVALAARNSEPSEERWARKLYYRM